MKSLVKSYILKCFPKVRHFKTVLDGFDEKANQFDSDGNLADWWEAGTKKAHMEKARCIIEQYGNFTEPNVKLKLNGTNTQAEDISDNAGIKEAYLAYQMFVKQNGAEQKLPGLNYTSNQMFWISAAQLWCSIETPRKLQLSTLI